MRIILLGGRNKEDEGEGEVQFDIDHHRNKEESKLL